MDNQNMGLRLKTSMKAFTLMLDEETKLKALIKLSELGVVAKKGALSATIRVLLNEFVNTDVSEEFIKKVEEEYLFTTTKNKRSSL